MHEITTRKEIDGGNVAVRKGVNAQRRENQLREVPCKHMSKILKKGLSWQINPILTHTPASKLLRIRLHLRNSAVE